MRLDITRTEELIKALTDERDYLRARVLQLEARISVESEAHAAERKSWLDRVIPERKSNNHVQSSSKPPITHYPMERVEERPPIPEDMQISVAEAEEAIVRHLKLPTRDA